MADQYGTERPAPDIIALSESLTDIAERSQQVLTDWLLQNGYDVSPSAISNPFNIAHTFFELTAKMMATPGQMVRTQMSLWHDHMALWQRTASRMMGFDVSEPELKDTSGRLSEEAWDSNEVFNFVKQSYLLSARWAQQTVGDISGLDAKSQQRADFYTRQFVSGLSPANFALSNPEVVRATMESGGENLLKGLRNVLKDLERSKGPFLRIDHGNDQSVRVGSTVATTPGNVIYRNALMEVIQYEPRTETVWRRPILFVPAWVNKFYLVDLRPENSWVRWLLDQGHTVFLISWVNPDTTLAHKTFEDYALDGVITALDVIEEATGERGVNVVGYCLGGTLLAATLAYLTQKGDERIVSATMLASLLDYADPGELGVYFDDDTIARTEHIMEKKGYLDASDVSLMFALLRENDLIWSYVVNNYLLGKDPFPYDFVAWSADCTNLPYALHSYYLRKICMENRLIKPGGLTIGGERLDLRRIKTPAYFLAAREDHIAPWRAAYKGTQVLGGPNRFALSASGHASGVINPPSDNCYNYWINTKTPADPDAWMHKAIEKKGSWWWDWQAWILRVSGKERVAAHRPGEGSITCLEAAPGLYVRRAA